MEKNKIIIIIRIRLIISIDKNNLINDDQNKIIINIRIILIIIIRIRLL